MLSPPRVTARDSLIQNTRSAALPFTARIAGPGPRTVTLLETNSWPLVMVMVPEMPVASIVSTSDTLASASRNEPGPLSLVLLTVNVAAGAGGARANTSADRVGINRDKLGVN